LWDQTNPRPQAPIVTGGIPFALLECIAAFFYVKLDQGVLTADHMFEGMAQLAGRG